MSTDNRLLVVYTVLDRLVPGSLTGMWSAAHQGDDLDGSYT